MAWLVAADSIETGEDCVTFGTSGDIALGRPLGQRYLSLR